MKIYIAHFDDGFTTTIPPEEALFVRDATDAHLRMIRLLALHVSDENGTYELRRRYDG